MPQRLKVVLSGDERGIFGGNLARFWLDFEQLSEEEKLIRRRELAVGIVKKQSPVFPERALMLRWDNDDRRFSDVKYTVL